MISRVTRHGAARRLDGDVASESPKRQGRLTPTCSLVRDRLAAEKPLPERLPCPYISRSVSWMATAPRTWAGQGYQLGRWAAALSADSLLRSICKFAKHYKYVSQLTLKLRYTFPSTRIALYPSYIFFAITAKGPNHDAAATARTHSPVKPHLGVGLGSGAKGGKEGLGKSTALAEVWDSKGPTVSLKADPVRPRHCAGRLFFLSPVLFPFLGRDRADSIDRSWANKCLSRPRVDLPDQGRQWALPRFG